MSLKPTPDELLEQIQKQEVSAKKGKLKIFFGMCAGVGKTYSMLQDAHTRQKEGVQVVIGVVNTHGRKETEELVSGIPLVPPMRIPYRGAVFEEFDLDAVLRMKPQLVLVDELAHTNVPGARHRKRWQDVEELLDAGIDVYTTLNVQHIESRKGLVESIAEVSIRETVPDSILERANSIEFIDIPPQELLTRLKEGKVYTGELSQIAIDHFFKEDNLTALREIALRLTAEKVEHDLHGLLALGGRGWKTRERLMVAINAKPTSEELIRAARKKAFEMDAPWICLHVETETPLTQPEQERLKKYLNLARELGGEVVNIRDISVSDAINQVVKQKDVTQIIVGRSPKPGLFSRLFKPDLIETLENENPNVDIIIMRQNRLQSLYEKIFPRIPQKEKIQTYIPEYIVSFLMVAAVTGIGKFIPPNAAIHITGFLFLLGLTFLSFYTKFGPILFAVILSTLSLASLFTENLSNGDAAATVIIYFIIATLIGFITTRLRRQELNLIRREKNSTRAIEIERQMGNSRDLPDFKNRVIPKLISIVPGEYDILTESDWQSSLPLLDNPNEMAIATWVLHNGKVAGMGTSTLSSAQGIYFPIKYRDKTNAVLAFQPAAGKSLNQEEMEFLHNVIFRMGGFIDRFTVREKEKEIDFTNQLEKLHQGILRSVSRSFYRPIEKIFDSFYKIKATAENSEEMQDLFEQTANSANDLKIIIDNIIAISELESGRVAFQIGKYNIHELLTVCRLELFSIISQHEFILDIPPHAPLLRFDFRLMKIALKNILTNAIEHSPIRAPIKIILTVSADTWSLSVEDRGPGIPSELIPLIFMKFYQAPNTQSQGIGIGLSIVKSVIDLHKGSILIEQNQPSGTRFTIILPL